MTPFVAPASFPEASVVFFSFFFPLFNLLEKVASHRLAPKSCVSHLCHICIRYFFLFFSPWQHVYFISLHTSGLSLIICQSLQRSVSVDRDVQPSGRGTRGGNDVSRKAYSARGVFQPVLWSLMMLWFISITYFASHCPFHKDPSAKFTKQQINCS